jgi:hypothetical protein
MRCRLRNTGLWLVCVVAVVVFSERQAWGTCGDYLDAPHGGMQNKTSLHSVLPVTNEPVKPPPCSGPGCHRRDSIPNAPAEIPTSIDSRDAILLKVDFAIDVEATTILKRSPVVGAVVFPVRVFRPPRFI